MSCKKEEQKYSCQKKNNETFPNNNRKRVRKFEFARATEKYPPQKDERKKSG